MLCVGLGGSTISQNIIKPKIIGDKSGLHPAFIVLSTLGGIACFGLIGVFLGPIICVLFIVCWEEFAQKYAIHKGKDIDELIINYLRSKKMKKILFLDRDGTLIREPIDYQIDSLKKNFLSPQSHWNVKKNDGLGLSTSYG